MVQSGGSLYGVFNTGHAFSSVGACNVQRDALNNIVTTTNSIAGKADKSYVDNALTLKATTTSVNAKADESYVDQQLNLKATTVSVNAKADKSYVDQIKETTDASVNTVTAALANKADKDDAYLKTDTYSKVETYTQAEVDGLLAKVYAAIEEGDKLRRQREADANDEGNGSSSNDNNGDGNFSVGVVVGATVPSVLLVAMLIAFIATRKNQGGGCQAGRAQQRGAKKAAARRGRQPARARQVRQQQDNPQGAYGQAASTYNNPTFSNAGDATYEEIDEDVEVMDANANTDMPDGFSANDNVQDDYGNDNYVEVMDAVADAVTDANANIDEMDYC